MKSTQTKKFQVDLGGVIALLSKNLYSSPGVYIRELLQNAMDAITASEAFIGAGASHEIFISPFAVSSPDSPAQEFSIRDSGIGITLEEVEQLLSTVGASSKNEDISSFRGNYIGQFGIGLLSCFLVADEITVLSRSARGGPSIRWVGFSDGTYQVSELEQELPVGTTVSLRPRPETVGWLRSERVCALARKYGEFLKADIVIDTPTGLTTVTHDFPFASFEGHRKSVKVGTGNVQYGGRAVGSHFDAIELDIRSTGTRGVLYVTNSTKPPFRGRGSRIYINNMLVCESDFTLMPSWGFFTWAVVNSTGLNPTASREALVEDSALLQTQREIATVLQKWLIDLSEESPERFQAFVHAHNSPIKRTVNAVPELASIIVPHMIMETSQGRMQISEIVEQSSTVLYASDVDDFRRIAAFTPEGRIIVNAGYAYDALVIETIPSAFPSARVMRVLPSTEIDDLLSPSVDDINDVIAFESRVNTALSSLDSIVDTRLLPDVNQPAVYVLQPGENQPGKLILNWGNRVIRALTATADDVIFSRAIQMLLVSARMAGQYDEQSDRQLLSTCLDDLILAAARVSEHDLLGDAQ
ncbi:MAG: HSP90 family protein [Propionibacteriaceae bacterium]|nr:HSP90 family protein [Propionibacteriaceae bacterium]